jgi:hypothetical protein
VSVISYVLAVVLVEVQQESRALAQEVAVEVR